MGSGKSTIASLLIDHLRDVADEEGNALAFYYFSCTVAHEQSMTHMIKTLIYQLLQDPKMPIPQSLSELRARPGNETQTELEHVLGEAGNQYKHVYLLFDAIDEADTLQTLKPLLQFLDEIGHGNCKILVTGRPHRHEIDVAFVNQPSLTIKATSEDLRLFMKSRIQTAGFHHLFDDELSAEISEALVNSAQGLFLLPTLQLNRLPQEPTRGDVEDVLQDLPRSVFGALRGELERVLHQSHSRCALALHTLMWLCMARDPMNADTLADILSLDLSQKRGLSERYRPSIQVVVECCHGLIQFEKRTGTYHLTHLAVREYLLANQIEYFQDTMANLVAKSCLLYILDSVIDNGPLLVAAHDQGREGTLPAAHTPQGIDAFSNADEMDVEQELVDFVGQHPFLKYFSRNWGRHIHGVLEESAIRTLTAQFLESRPRIARASQIDRFLSGYRYFYWNPREAWSTNGVILASGFGLSGIVCKLLDAEKEQVDNATSIGTTALIITAARDRVELVRELLKRNADPLRQNWYGNALHCAAERNAVSVVRELLSIGIDVNVESPLGRTALSCTVDQDCEDAARELLSSGATMWYGTDPRRARLTDMHTSDEDLRAVQCPFLADIMENGAVRTVRMLLDSGFITRDESIFIDTVIHVLAEKGYISLYEAGDLIKTRRSEPRRERYIRGLEVGDHSIYTRPPDAEVDRGEGSGSNIELG